LRNTVLNKIDGCDGGNPKNDWIITDCTPPHHKSKVYGLVQDIDTQKTIEADLNAARREAENANRAKSEFLARMSHELRTPMNSILGFSQLLETDSLLSNDQRSAVNEIITAGDHLLMLIDELLDLAKIESGSLEVYSEPVAVGPVIRECLALVSRLAEQVNVTIDQTAIDESTVWADRVRLKQALLNLLSNAIKYNVRGGKVTMETHQIGDGTLGISVKDTGIGIAASQMEELFEPFKRLGAESTEIEGTGIGLALTRHIVEIMGGSVTAASEVGVGSTFTVELPMTSLHMDVEPYAASGETSERDGTSRFASRTGERTILYIEDNPANLKLVSRVLDSYKHLRLLTADRAELGIELALKHHPDVVLLDINLPEMSGYDVIDRLKETDALVDVPIIAVTANAMLDDIERGRQAGFTDYITKPLDLNRFKAILDRILTSMSS
jgi:CheY-like chemotaxis protein